MKTLMKIKENKIFKIIITAIRIFIVLILFIFILAVCMQRFSDNKLSFMNYRLFSVVSGSMAPRYNVGEVLVSKDVPPEDIKVGDTISYLGSNGDFRGKVITHEVISIDKDENDKYIFHSKGLVNLVEDPDVSEDQLYGVVVYKTFLLSLIYKIISTSVGFYLVIILPLLFIIVYEIVATLIEKEDKKREIANNN